MKASKTQKKYIYNLCSYQTRLKEEMVQWATDSIDKISTNDLTFDLANKIIVQLGGTAEKPDNWAVFDKTKMSHKNILRLCIQIGWRKKHDKYGWVANLERLNNFLHTKSPVKKKLTDMEKEEVSKVIVALEGVYKSKFK